MPEKTPMKPWPESLCRWSLWLLLIIALTAQAAHAVIKSPHDPRSYETLDRKSVV